MKKSTKRKPIAKWAVVDKYGYVASNSHDLALAELYLSNWTQMGTCEPYRIAEIREVIRKPKARGKKKGER